MSKWDLSQYQTVTERVNLFWEKYPNGRYNLEVVSLTDTQIVIRGELWTDMNDEHPRTVDFAEEHVGSNPVNKISWVENCATSCLGRMISGLGGEFAASPSSSSRASREELEKVQRHEAGRDWVAVAKKLDDKDKLRALWADAKKSGAADDVLKAIQEMAEKK